MLHDPTAWRAPKAIYLAVAPKPLSSHQYSLLPALVPLGYASRQAQEQGASVHTSAYFNSHLQAEKSQEWKDAVAKNAARTGALQQHGNVFKRHLALQVVGAAERRAARKHLYF